LDCHYCDQARANWFGITFSGYYCFTPCRSLLEIHGTRFHSTSRNAELRFAFLDSSTNVTIGCRLYLPRQQQLKNDDEKVKTLITAFHFHQKVDARCKWLILLTLVDCDFVADVVTDVVAYVASIAKL